MPSNKKDARVLVVDDEQGMRDFLAYELSDAGYEVTTASDGCEALEQIKKQSYPVVLTDIMMPNMNGLDLLDEIKKINPYVEVVMATGFGQVDHAVKAMKSGAYDFIQKPYTVQEILMVIEKALEKSRLRQSRDAAVEASRAKSEFLATMSHEIRTPLNAIVGMTELLSETSLSGEQKEYVQILQRGSDTLLSLINDILDLSKVESGCLELEEIAFDVYEFMEKTAEFMAVRSHQKGLELNCRIADDVPAHLLGDSNRLRQILINLLGNAIKFTEKGEIVLSVELAKKTEGDLNTANLLFSVKDTGIGIPEEKLNAVFEPFTQADSSTTRKYGGTGLGLSISKKFIELMGGKIGVLSQQGKGTNFYFELPVKINPSAGAKESVRNNMELRGIRALVVDDNATNRFIMREALIGWGLAAAEVDGGAPALEELERAHSAGKPYVLVLLDCRMPGMNGFEVAEKIKNHSLLSHDTVIMMLTSDNRHGDIARAKDLDLGGYLVKPVKRSALYRAIQEALVKRHKLQMEIPSIRVNAATGKLRILLAEDSDDNRVLIERFLKGTAYELTFAENGERAVQLAQAGEYDVVLMDINMPVLDGYEATRRIREWEKGRKHRSTIIALTANAMKESLQKCMEAGCDTYVTKPVKKMVLLEVLSHFERKAAA